MSDPATQPLSPSASAARPDVAVGQASNLEGSFSHARANVRERAHKGTKTRLFVLASLASHISQIGREVVSAFLFGISAQMSAFTLAFQLPHLVRALVADSALSAAFVPTFTDLRARGEDERAWQLAGTVAALMLMLTIPLTALALYFAPQVVGVFADPGFSQMGLAVTLFRMLFPIVAVMSLGGLVIGILNAAGEFTIGALAPIAWNVMIIAGLAVSSQTVAPGHQIYAYAIAVAIGTLVQAVLPIPWLKRAGGRWPNKLIFSDPAVRQILALMLPVSLCLGLINFNLLVDIHYATRLAGLAGQQGPAALDKALRLYMIPVGAIAVGVTTVAFPHLVRAAHAGQKQEFSEVLARATRRMLCALSLPALMVPALSLPIVRLVYERGAFTGAQARLVSDVLAALSAGMLFSGIALLSIRALFAYGRTWLPTAVAVGNLAVNVVLDRMWYADYGLAGIALATTVCNALAWAALCYMVRRQTGCSQWGQAWSVGLRALSAAAVCTAMAWGIVHAVSYELGSGLLVNALALAAGVAAAVVLYRFLLRALKLSAPPVPSLG